MFDKFRVWDSKNKRYGLPVYTKPNPGYTEIEPPAGGRYELEVCTPYRVGDTEIFVGDIISFKFFGIICTGKVVFDVPEGQFLVTDGNHLNVPLREVVTLDEVTVTRRTK